MIAGERSLDDKMKNISKQASLSKTYANHSIRPKVVEASHLMAVSGHKNESSSSRKYSKLLYQGIVHKKRDVSIVAQLLSTTRTVTSYLRY